MSEFGTSQNPMRSGHGLNRRGRLLAMVLGLLAFAGIALAGPAASQASEYFEANVGGSWSTPGSYLDIGPIKTGATLDQQFRMRSNTTVFSNTQRTGQFVFSNANFSYISNCSGTSYSWTGETANGFTMGKRQGSFSSSFDCAFTARVKNSLPPGNYQTTLNWNNAGNFVTGSTIIRYTVADPSMTVTGPGGSASPLDFGDVAVGDLADRTLTVRNTSPFPITGMNRALTGSPDLSILSTTCGATLAPNTDCTVTVRYQPSSVSSASGSLNVTTGTGHSGSFSFTGEGVPAVADLTVNPSTYDYGDVVHGFPAPRAYTVANAGNTTLSLSFAQTGGTNPAVLYRNGGTCGATLGVGLSCTMVVEFDPDENGPAAQSGGFEVTGTTPLVGTPASQSIAITGTRTPPASTIEPRNTANDTVVTSHSYNGVNLGGSSAYTFKIANTGNITISSIVPTLSGPEAGSYSITGNTCGAAILRDTSCNVTVTVSPQRATPLRATLTLTPANGVVTAPPRTVVLSTQASGIQIKNDDTINMTGLTQKRWLDSASLGTAGTIPADYVRAAFEVELPAGSSVAGVDIVGNTTTNDTAPVSGFQDILGQNIGKVNVERKPGSNQALVRVEVPLSGTNMGTGNGQYGFSGGTDWIVSCSGGTARTWDRRVWFRVRGSNGEVSPTVGSMVRMTSQLYACPYNQGGFLSNQKITQVNGVAQPNNTIEVKAGKTDPVTFQFNTRTYAKGAVYPGADGSVDAMDWRIRNSKTGDMFRVDNSNLNVANYIPCGPPCNVTSSTNRYNFPEGWEAGQKTFTIPPIPSRGRWIVEASPQGSDEKDDHYFELGVVRVNDNTGSSPTITKTGTLGLRPNTDQAYTIGANVADPADPVNPFDTQGGRGQVIEWDLDGDTSNGLAGDGFEFRSESAPGSNLPAQDLVQAFDTTGKTPGPYTIRAKVTDNGAFMSNDSAAESKILTFVTTINSPAEATAETVQFESDDSQPGSVKFNATDVDSDAYRVDITPDGTNNGTLGGNHHDGIGNNTKPYTWPATFTGSDNFDFVATDDHNGTGAHQTLTVRVRPNTQIDAHNIAGLLHPDASNPTTRFLGSTTATDAEFDFSSLQNPVTSIECKLTNDGNIVQDWGTCASTDNGSISFDTLADGLHKLEVRAVNSEGDRDGTPAFRTWRVDNTGPDSEVRVGPPSNLPNQQPRFTNDTTPSYNFRATASERSLQQYMTYECKVMWGPVADTWYPCGAPSNTLGSGTVHIVNGTPDFGFSNPLADGTYEMKVRATDEVGNLGSVMTEQFTVDTVPPETGLASGPEGLVNTRTVDYVLGSSQGQSTFRCKLEGQNSGVVFPMALCPGSAADGSKPNFTGLADDIYTLTAIAVDPGTNPDPTPLVVNFEVDATEPTTSMDPQVDFGDGPTLLRRTQSRKVDITFTGADSRQLQGFQCRIDSTDDSAWQVCSSPQRFSGLADGPHKVEIRSKDEAGNVDSAPEVLEWVVDRTPPVTGFTVSPGPVTNNANPALEFDANEAISGSQCQLDSLPTVACTSPVTLADLGAPGGIDDGMHTVTVRSTDIAGNVEATDASVSWRQDTVDPAVTFSSKPAAYMPLGDADFAWDVKDGDPLVLAPEVDAECALDPVDPDNIVPGEWQSCDRDLTVSSDDNVNGPHFLAVRAIDQAGNVSAQAGHHWTVLGSKPNSPVIDDSKPVEGETTRVGTAYFAFSHELDNTGALDGYFCSIDGGAASRCEGNFSTDGLSDGSHTFSVVVKDIAGNISDPTVIGWEVQRGAPFTQIDFGPNGARKTATASFQFSSNKPGTFECRLDSGDWEVCDSPVNLNNLSDGQHTFRIRAVSSVAPVGVKDPTPASREWTVDTVAPDVAIDSAPEGQVVSYSGDVSFHSADPEATFQCKVGAGLFDDCSSPLHLTGLPAGEATVTVRAVDPAGNVSSEPATASWTVLDPSCGDDFEGTPPNCVKKPDVIGKSITADSTGGTLSLAALGSVDLPANQVKLKGQLGEDGRWFVPREGVTFLPVTQLLEDAIGPGVDVTVTISIKATGNGWGTLATGGAAKMKLPVKAEIDAKLGNTALFPPGSCELSPVTFNLIGTWDPNAMTAHVEQGDVAFPKLTGCGTFKVTIDQLLELPRNDIQMAVDFALTEEAAVCTAPQIGTPPNCVNPTVKLARPVVKGPKKITPGKKAVYRVRLANKGNSTATAVKVCLKAPAKLVKGKAKRCKKVPTIKAGKSVIIKFALKGNKAAKPSARGKLLVTATYKDGKGKTGTVSSKVAVRAGKAKGK